MKINRVDRTPFGEYKITAAKNKHIKYLYNEVQDAIRGQGISATFTNKDITLGRLTKAVQKRLEELKIVFTKDKK